MPTATSILDQHVTLAYRSIDRLFLNAYVPLLQTGGGLRRFLERDGPFTSPVLLQHRSDAFVAALKAYAQEHGAPWILSRRRERKEERVRPLFESAERERRSGLVAVVVAQERMSAWYARKLPTPRGSFIFHWARKAVVVNHFYLYLLDPEWGPSFIKIAGYAPSRYPGVAQRAPVAQAPAPPPRRRLPRARQRPGQLRRSGRGERARGLARAGPGAPLFRALDGGAAPAAHRRGPRRRPCVRPLDDPAGGQ